MLSLMAAPLTVALLLALRRVPEGRVYTLHRFGRFVRALPPGLHLTWPLLDQIGHEIDLVGHHVELAMPRETTRAEVFFQILDPDQTGAALDEVDDLVLRMARDRLDSLDANPGLPEPKAIAQRLKDELNQRLRGRGLHVTRCQLA